MEVDPSPVVDPNEEKTDELYKMMFERVVKNSKPKRITASSSKTGETESLLKKVKKTKQSGIQSSKVEVDLLDGQPIDWRNLDGYNYLTYVRNQHIPTYCGSCWAQAGVSVMMDRLYINQLKENQPFPRHNLSVQSIINCAQGGTCFGGDSSLLFQKAEKWTVPLETCKNYVAYNSPDETRFDCEANPQLRCSTFDSITTQERTIKQFAGMRVTSWSRVRGVKAMKEALKTGPIECAFEVTPEFVDYRKEGGEDQVEIYEELKNFYQLNHAVSLVGWGVKKDGEEEKGYWIVRNSWGRHWGYDGFFYISMGNNSLGFESDCVTAEPVFVP